MARTATDPGENARVGELVADFYNKYPFPGYDINKYNFKDDLFKNANAYARALDMQIPLDATVADLGCGTGQLACLLAARGRTVYAGDFSAASLEAAQQRRGHQHDPDSRLRQSPVDFAEQRRAEDGVLLAEPDRDTE